MTELEQYKKAYATLVGRVDNVIIALLESGIDPDLTIAAGRLTKALQEAEEIFLAEDPEAQKKGHSPPGECPFGILCPFIWS